MVAALNSGIEYIYWTAELKKRILYPQELLLSLNPYDTTGPISLFTSLWNVKSLTNYFSMKWRKPRRKI